MDPRLFRVATSGNVDFLTVLAQENRIILFQVTPIKDTALHISVRLGHLNFANKICDLCPELFSISNSNGDTPLIIAARAGHLEILRSLIDCGKKYYSGDVEIGRSEALKFLRERNVENNNAMHEAVRNGHLEVVKLLIAEDPELLCSINNDWESPLYLAVERPALDALDIVKEILNNTHYAHSGPDGRTALHAAVIHENQDITKLLLKKKEGLLSEADDNKRTPLHFTATLGYNKMVEQLLKCDTSTAYLQDKYGFAPIHVAAANGHIDIINELLRCCPDMKDLHNSKGQNILHIAVEHSWFRLVSRILKMRQLEGLINEKDDRGNTPLHQATISCDPFMVNFLVKDPRVDVKATNKERLTALQIAESEGYNGISRSKALLLATLLRYASPPWSKPSAGLRKLFHNYMRANTKSTNFFNVNTINVLLLVAVLIATVTFTAGFTLPKGYDKHGKEVNMRILLANNTDFQIFVKNDVNAMYFSMTAVVALMFMQLISNGFISTILLLVAAFFVYLAFALMATAFLSGVNVAVSGNKSLMHKNVVDHMVLVAVSQPLFFIIAYYTNMFERLDPSYLPGFLSCWHWYLRFLNELNRTPWTSERTACQQHLTQVSMLFCYERDDNR